MRASQQIFRMRRQYNQWVGNQTLEDYALRFTATKSRRWSIDKVAKTALGATAFLALEAIAAAVTLRYGFANTLWAMLTVSLVIFVTGFPITYYAAKHGLDIDLLTRSAGFGYLGSTITSLIYASFTFLFFAIESAILASALKAMFGIPLEIAYVICALAVIPIVTHGITAISRFQIGTQPLWLTLQCIALVVVGYFEFSEINNWTHYAPAHLPNSHSFNLALFGGAASVFFAMVAQIGEQVDYLRFMPEKTASNRKRWWFWLTLAGPGWIFPGMIKMLLGSFLAYIAISRSASVEQATDPVYMYQMVFGYITHSPTFALMLAGVMVIISQMKINVTNAYAGSIAWSNFFSRLTHSHPGRVVWLVFNVVIALILMELGIYRALESILGIFAIIALSWLSSLSADLLIAKPLGLSPKKIEFKRSHLYDVNPVGVGSMVLASIVGILCYLGQFGTTAKYLAHFISIGVCFISVPVIAAITQGRYYLARHTGELDLTHLDTQLPGTKQQMQCCICETPFELQDMSHCPAYQGAICSLCCSLDARCLDSCKPQARLAQQASHFFSLFLPAQVVAVIDSRIGRFTAIFFCINLVTAALLSLIYYQMSPTAGAEADLLWQTLWTLFFTLMIIFGVISWLFLLAHESQEVAQQESNRQTQRLIEEIEAHQATDRSLQEAKEIAERANHAKSRYLTGISHELRTPLQSVLGYAQLLSQRQGNEPEVQKGLEIIRRNGEYLTDLIEGLLDLSKIEAGRLDIYRNKFKLPELMEQLVQMFAPQAAHKGIEFHYHVNSNLPPVVMGDEKRLRQILINLLSNAIKYTEKGRVDFSIKYRNQVAEFAVRDTGVGISDKDKQRILAPFERIRNLHVPNVSGTGLGLTIVHLLTEVMGGELRVSSTPGQGSEFTVSLMLSRLDSPYEETAAPRLIRGYEGATKVIMIVDDEPVHRGLMADILNPLGFSTVEAQDAKSCLELVDDTRADLYLLDVSMPETDGLTLAQTLRNQGIKAPIMMVSADAQERHKNLLAMQNETCAHDDYMVKPISNRILLEKIGRLLHLQWQYETSSATAEIPSTNPTHSGKQLAPLPQHALLRELDAYAKVGYCKGVNKTMVTIQEANILDADQLNHLQQFTKALRYPQLCEWLANVITTQEETS